MRPFHNNIAQNYRVEGASPLGGESSTSVVTFCPRPKKSVDTQQGRETDIVPRW